MRRHTVEVEVLGPWSLTTSRAFWEGFSPAALPGQRAGDGIRTVFRVEADWSRAEVDVTHHGSLPPSTWTAAVTWRPPPTRSAGSCPSTSTRRGWPDVARGMSDAGDERDVSDRSGSPRGIG